MNLLLADLHKFVGYSGGIEHVLSRMAVVMKEKGYHVSVVMADAVSYTHLTLPTTILV